MINKEENVIDNMEIDEFLLVFKYKRDDKIYIDFINEKIEDINKWLSPYIEGKYK